MSKRIKELADRYGINTHIDILELFATEIYGDGVKAGVEKEANAALRDYFAASAMQGLLTSDGCGIDSVSEYAYKCADAMLKAREVGDE